MSLKDHSLLEILADADENRANGDELVEARKMLPADVERGLPLCMMSNYGDWEIAIIAKLAWIMAKRDDPNISLKDVQRRINMNNIRAVVKKVAYFFSDFSEDEIDLLFDKPAIREQLGVAVAEPGTSELDAESEQPASPFPAGSQESSA